ncbi:MAG: DUF4338 domain-containing protein, partial [Caldilineaceae bacterium]|nr:DUF4338 domain-containing protein [Caldilineaceae bacterium]
MINLAINTRVAPSTVDFTPVRPELQERFLARFHITAREMLQQPREQWDAVIRDEVLWAFASSGNPDQQARYQSVWLLLRDLFRIGWTPAWDEKSATLKIAPPPMEDHPHSQRDIDDHKGLRRAIMRHERMPRLHAAQGFITDMENPTRGLPITAVIADGHQIAADLRRVRQISDDVMRRNELGQIVQPYLQLVTENGRCSHTGLLLRNIWRYFRLTWSSPVYNTPGRSMFYLVRDAARPFHPVMGIASLENSPIFIGARDDLLGWTVESFVAALRTDVEQAELAGTEVVDVVRAAFERLLGYIQQSLIGIKIDEICTPGELLQPTPALVRRLTHLADEYAHAREKALRDWLAFQEQSEENGEGAEQLKQSIYGNISEEAQRLLFMKKRAGELARLLGARLEIEQLLVQRNLADAWQDWCMTERGRSAVRNGLVSVKNRHVGTSILELNVCGAVPPYNELLAGKLTALLMCSPQVAEDYRERYGAAESEIASQIRGEPVVRSAELVYIGTTALYTAGASQYNRLKLPAGLLRKDAAETPMRYLGITEGYGTSHISDATTIALEIASSDDFLDVNHVMGEGVSPKMRIIRRGLDAIFRNGQRSLSDKMAKHQMQRLIYGVWLAENGRDYLLGLDDTPRYIWDDDLLPAAGTARIANFWRTRWLDQRIQYEPALERLEKFSVEEILLSRELDDDQEADWAYTLMKIAQRSAIQRRVGNLAADMTPDERQRQLVRNLYRGATAMADDVPFDDLRRLHVRTRLDDVITEHIRAGRSVVLTGNPGDGKTHLLRILEPEIAALGAIVEEDASAVPNELIAENWRRATTASKPYFIAVNESVLFKLAESYPEFAPLQSARHQVINAIGHGVQPDLPITDVVVFDLSHRHTLSRDLVADVFDKLTNADMLPRCAQCPVHGCDRERNQLLLQGSDNRVRYRLQAIFDAITRRGVHVTMRDLEGFVAYLLFADRDCVALLQQSDDAELALPQLPYRGQGALFDAVRQSFDPARVCHPIFDDALLNNTLAAEDWLHPDRVYSGSLDAQATERFNRRKREFYFYHRHGDALLQLTSDDEQAFAAFLAEKDARTALRNILRKLTIFFGRVADSDHLPVWQSHRYDQSAQRILYAVQQRERREFELLAPRLA